MLMINRKLIVNSPDDRLRQFSRMPIPSIHQDFTKSLVMEIWFKVMEKAWKSHGNPLVKMCMNPVASFREVLYFVAVAVQLA